MEILYTKFLIFTNYNHLLTVVVFQLVGECAAEEGGGSVIARIVKEGNVSLANSVTLSITPLTVEDAEDRVSLLDIPPLNELSPNRAGMTRVQ